MGLFSSLSEKLSHVFSKLTSRGKLTELEIKQAMREIRVALLEADVNFPVVKDFVARVSEKAVGQEILKSLSPTQQVIKIVNEEVLLYYHRFAHSVLYSWSTEHYRQVEVF